MRYYKLTNNDVTLRHTCLSGWQSGLCLMWRAGMILQVSAGNTWKVWFLQHLIAWYKNKSKLCNGAEQIPHSYSISESWKKDFEPFPNHYKEWRSWMNMAKWLAGRVLCSDIARQKKNNKLNLRKITATTATNTNQKHFDIFHTSPKLTFVIHVGQNSY